MDDLQTKQSALTLFKFLFTPNNEKPGMEILNKAITTGIETVCLSSTLCASILPQGSLRLQVVIGTTTLTS